MRVAVTPLRAADAAGSFFTERLRTVDWDFPEDPGRDPLHEIHSYPAKFPPAMPSRLIAELSSPGDRVLDPFCGSGTTLLEALRSGRSAIGVDANPLATLIARVKTQPISGSQAIEAKLELERIYRAAPNAATDDIRSDFLTLDVPVPPPGYRGRPRGLQFWFDDHVLSEIAALARLVDGVDNSDIRNLFKVALSSITLQVSKQDSDTRYVRREKLVGVGDTIQKFYRKANDILIAVSLLESDDCSSSIVCADSRNLTFLEPRSVDLVVTSPPYPNAWSYHLYHQNRMLVLGLNPWVFKGVEIGCHRDYSAKNGATRETFLEDMRSCMDGLHSALRSDRFCCLVVGPSIVRGELVDNAELIRKAGESVGFRHVIDIARTINARKKAFNPSIGKIRSESIVVLRKP